MNKAVINEDPNARMIRELKEEIARLKGQGGAGGRRRRRGGGRAGGNGGHGGGVGGGRGRAIGTAVLRESERRSSTQWRAEVPPATGAGAGDRQEGAADGLEQRLGCA